MRPTFVDNQNLKFIDFTGCTTNDMPGVYPGTPIVHCFDEWLMNCDQGASIYVRPYRLRFPLLYLLEYKRNSPMFFIPLHIMRICAP